MLGTSLVPVHLSPRHTLSLGSVSSEQALPEKTGGGPAGGGLHCRAAGRPAYRGGRGLVRTIDVRT